MKLYLTLALLMPLTSNAQLKTASIFTDNMVLQRDRPIRLWGKGIPGALVEVSLSDEDSGATVTADSTWIVKLKARKASAHPLSVRISSGNEIVHLRNILVGDIWLCIGQSNMEWPMSREEHFQEELRQGNQPLLRFYNPTYAGKNIFGKEFPDSILARLNTSRFFAGRWEESDPVSARTMTAVGYYFGKEIVDQMEVPVGLIHLAIGGAPIETFIDREVLKSNARFRSKVNGNWLDNPDLPTWVRERGYQNVGESEDVSRDDLGPNHAFKPGFAYASGINPIISLPIAGILWYQGESNAQEVERVDEYVDLMKLMVEDYRTKWSEPELPFYFVQLSSIDTTNYNSRHWPRFRDEQRMALEQIPNSGMAVSSDHGARNDVHPTNKKVIGERLSKWALHYTYKQNIVPSGPLPVSAYFRRNKVIVRFKFVSEGLKVAGDGAVRGFSKDGRSETTATVRRRSVMIASEKKPDFIYYAWSPFTNANLTNSARLPASTFKIKVQ